MTKKDAELLSHFDFSQKKSLKMIIYEGLKNTILDGSLAIGDRINEKYIADQLAVSRTPIRQAIQMLVEDDLIEVIPNYGAHVRNFNQDSLQEIYEIRYHLESLFYQRIFQHISDVDIQTINKSLNIVGRQDYEMDTQDLMSTNYTIKKTLNRIAHSPILINLMEYLEDYMDSLEVKEESIHGQQLIQYREYKFIYASLKANDLESLDKMIQERNKRQESLAQDIYAEIKNKGKDSPHEEDNLSLLICKVKDCLPLQAIKSETNS